MKAGELLNLIDEALANVRTAIVAFQMRILESPHTAHEFLQKSLELQEEVERLEKLRKEFEALNPDKELRGEDIDALVRYLEALRNFRGHEF
ncbi:hypothetical protein [Pyrococcus yayanosii]|uniref:Uncharacterized protein n=1 Tax=Pyrococcus yayanosii (strain CH1 / JCM 16557) TaxID=529709 RepID=F8AFX6_PYRYC|nr:hypothetical protein [Pyrococcus yayanosii]AEH23882.1 hypothetical protein PYCH_01730 [Pyrococcus yayanosii CH1]